MLVFTRRPGQSIVIDNVIKITILSKNKERDGQVRVGIEAPKYIIVDREEIWNKKQEDEYNEENYNN